MHILDGLGWMVDAIFMQRSQRVSAGMFYRGEQTGNLPDHGKVSRKVQYYPVRSFWPCETGRRIFR